MLLTHKSCRGSSHQPAVRAGSFPQSKRSQCQLLVGHRRYSMQPPSTVQRGSTHLGGSAKHLESISYCYQEVPSGYSLRRIGTAMADEIRPRAAIDKAKAGWNMVSA